MRVRAEGGRWKRGVCMLGLTMLLLLANAGTLSAGWRMVERARRVRSMALRERVLRPGRIAPRHVANGIDESCAICHAAATKSEWGALLSDWWTAIHCALCRLYHGEGGQASESVLEIADDDGVA